MLRGLLNGIVHLMEPLGLIWLFLLGMAAWKFRRKEKRQAWAFTGAAVFMWLIGATSFPALLVASLEKPYAGLDMDNLPKSDAVVMLGGGTSPSLNEVQHVNLNIFGDRMIMAHSLVRRGNAPVLFMGGPTMKLGEKEYSEPMTVQNWFIHEAGITNEIVVNSDCYSTRDEALQVSQLAKERGWESILLVTSASHMRRASGTFRTHLEGVRVFEVPCAFLTSAGEHGSYTIRLVPMYHGFRSFSFYFHELVGWYYYRLRGWINSASAAEKTPFFKR